jgi:hypothetical protein
MEPNTQTHNESEFDTTMISNTLSNDESVEDIPNEYIANNINYITPNFNIAYLYNDDNRNVYGNSQNDFVNGLSINTDDDNIDAKYECCVCFGKKKRYDIVYTLCGIGQQTSENMHFTCRDCRLQLQNTGNNKCPLCRGRL